MLLTNKDNRWSITLSIPVQPSEGMCWELCLCSYLGNPTSPLSNPMHEMSIFSEQNFSYSSHNAIHV